MNDLVKTDYKGNALNAWYQQNPELAQRNIDQSTWNALCQTIYPGAKPESVIMAVDYCQARNLDVMLKPVHLVPMSVKNAQTGNFEWRDVPMPGVGLYRIQADRSGTYAGSDEPEFGPSVTQEFKSKSGKSISVTYPEWCKYTVYKLIGDRLVAFTAKEYWIENYATEGKDSDAPNAMWKKRVFGQLAKCAEAQALRKAWPEIGQEPTAEEMEGKFYGERDITPSHAQPTTAKLAAVKTSLKNRIQPTQVADVVAEQSAVADEAPDFDEPQYSPQVQAMINSLIDCYEPEHFVEWENAAAKMNLAKNSPEYVAMVGAYQNRKRELKNQGA
jgi:phage recombination protein Bet